MRFVLNENTLAEIAKVKEIIKENEATLIVDKCVEDKIVQRIFLQGDYKPLSPEELKRKQKMPKFKVAYIEYKENDFDIKEALFITFDDAYNNFIEGVQKLQQKS